MTPPLDKTKLIPLRKAAPLVPCGPRSIYRYAEQGTRDGVRLRYETVGERRLYTCLEWIEQFRAECKAAREAKQRRRVPVAYGGLVLPDHQEALWRLQTGARRRA